MTRPSKEILQRHSKTFGIALLASGLFAANAQADEYTKSFTVSNRANVRVDTNDGSVRVSTGEGNQVEFHVTYMGYTLDKDLHIDSSQQGDQVTLTARLAMKWGLMLGTHKLHIEVRMPKDADLKVDTGDGAVQAASLRGNISIRTGDGAIDVGSLSGNITLHSGDGAIEGSDLDGKLDATSGDGRVRLAGRFDALRIKTGDGGIDARALQGSKVASDWKIVTGDGSIDLSLPQGIQADVDASSSDGHVNSDIPITVDGLISNSRVRGKMNGGGQSLIIRTGDGSIRLKQA